MGLTGCILKYAGATFSVYKKKGPLKWERINSSRGQKKKNSVHAAYPTVLWSILVCIYLMLLNCSVGEDSWESLGLQGDPTSPSYRRLVLGVHWKDWCWSWNSNTLATSCEELTHLKRPWYWERLRAGGEGDDRGWDGWMASPTRWTWVWLDSRSWWWTGRSGVLWFMGLQRVGHDWATELNWIYLHTQTHTTLLIYLLLKPFCFFFHLQWKQLA